MRNADPEQVDGSSRGVAVVTDSDWSDLEFEELGMAGRLPLRRAEAGGGDDLLFECRAATVLLVQRLSIDAALMDALPRLQGIVRYGMGVDNIDIEAARRRNVRVCSVPDYCIAEVTEHTCALVAASSRKLWWHVDAALNGAWGYRGGPMPRLSSNDPVGVVGAGRIGSAVIERLLSLGYPVHVYDPSVEAGQLPPGALAAGSLEELADSVNHLTLHLPVTDETRYVIDLPVLKRLGPDGHLVNTARGQLVNEQHLLTALDSGLLGSASLDVLAQEPPTDRQHRLIRHERVTVTPHVAYLSTDSLPRLRTRVGEIAGDLLDEFVATDVENGAGT